MTKDIDELIEKLSKNIIHMFLEQIVYIEYRYRLSMN